MSFLLLLMTCVFTWLESLYSSCIFEDVSLVDDPLQVSKFRFARKYQLGNNVKRENFLQLKSFSRNSYEIIDGLYFCHFFPLCLQQIHYKQQAKIRQETNRNAENSILPMVEFYLISFSFFFDNLIDTVYWKLSGTVWKK